MEKQKKYSPLKCQFTTAAEDIIICFLFKENNLPFHVKIHKKFQVLFSLKIIKPCTAEPVYTLTLLCLLYFCLPTDTEDASETDAAKQETQYTEIKEQ